MKNIYENKANERVSSEEVWQALGSHTMHNCALAVLPTAQDASLIMAEDLERQAPKAMPFVGKRAIVRSDGTQIGIVGDGYHLEQPRDVIDGVLGAYIATGKVRIESASYLQGGCKFFYTACIDGVEADIGHGDSVSARISGGTSFDGSMGATVYQGGFRPICTNQLALWSNGIASGNLLMRARHTKNFAIKVEQARQHIAQVVSAFDSSVEAYQEMARKPMNDAQAEEYVREVFGANNDSFGKHPSTKKENQVGYILDLRDIRAEKELVPSGTAWNAYNAVTYYLSHEMGRNEESRSVSNFAGQYRAMNERALDLALN